MNKIIEWWVRLNEFVISFVRQPARFQYKNDETVKDTKDDYDYETGVSEVDYGPRDEFYPHPYEAEDTTIEVSNTFVVEEPTPEKKTYKRKTSDSVKLIVNNKKKSK